MRCVLKAEAKSARTPLSASPPELEARPVITTERMSTRVADVLKRVRNGSLGSPPGISGNASAPSELGRDNLDRLPSQPVRSVSETLENARFSDSESPEAYGPVPERGGVRFIQPIGTARKLALTGDFCGWSPEGIPLTLDPGGRYLELLLPLEPGRHEYQLISDGIPGPDPYAAVRTSGPEDVDRSLVHVTQEPGRRETPSASGMEPRRT